ncbi:rhamnose mutarotase [Periconia macrospinosa]|uniref:Rhamnose mutarotase n=1 Tax=Periconia macrospinosa TaxID=97972 RepID=A0A2V1DIW6_9PLEO|nr:rhamnose mutarotase [Periconia macrospinosa]
MTTAALAAQEQQQGPRRIAQYIYLQPGSEAAYRECHAKVWPKVLEQIKDSNIEDYSINIIPSPSPSSTTTHHPIILVATFKYTGTSYSADMARMAANETVQEWWNMTDAMQVSPVEGATGSMGEKGWWGQCEEVFRLE